MKRTPKRRARRPFATFVKRFWLFGAIFAVALAYGGWRLVELPAFHLSSLAVTGLERVSREDVVARAAIDPSANVWLLDRSAIVRRIEAIPYVDRASLSIRPPSAVAIAVTEREPDGCVRDDRGTALTVDATDRIVQAGCAPDAPVSYRVRAPLEGNPGETLHVATLTTLQNDRRTLDARGERYRAYAFDPFGELQATLRDGVVVEFGDDADLVTKERLVGPILAQVALEGRPIRAVDLRAERTPVVVFKPASPSHPQPVHRL